MADDQKVTVEDELPYLREFIVRIGGAIIASGDSIDSTQRTLHRIVSAYGRDDFEFFVLPTGSSTTRSTGSAGGRRGWVWS